MEPITIALICAASFGALVALSAFVRQLLLSRDKNLNDQAQKTALTQEIFELEKMRIEMQNNKRFEVHYKVLGTNKDSIIYLDNKVEDILKKKEQLIERYSQLITKESNAIVDGQISVERKIVCDRLKQEMDNEIAFYNTELEQLQKKRAELWDAHTDLETHLVEQEKSRNDNLDGIYKQQTGVLEKIYIRHMDESEHVAVQTIEAGTTAFKSIILAPIQFLLQYFNLSTGIDIDQTKLEKAVRDAVKDAQKELDDTEADPTPNEEQELRALFA